jgi:hypothetical protein
MPAWPSTLPSPQHNGYSLEPIDAVARTDMEVGKMRMRSRVTRQPLHLTVAWYFTNLQLSVFEAWWEQQINRGAAAFTITLRNGYGAQTVTARFLGPYKAPSAGRGLGWDVSATLEVETMTQLSSAALAPYL